MKWFGKKKQDRVDDHEAQPPQVDDDSNESSKTDSAPTHSKQLSKKEARKQKKQRKKAAKQGKKNDRPKRSALDWSRNKVTQNSAAGSPDDQLRQVRTRGLVDPNQSSGDEGTTQFLDDYEEADQDFNKYTQAQYVRKFKFPYIGSKKELTNLYQAHVSITDAKRLLLERFVVTAFLGFGFGLAMMVFLKKGIILSGIVGIVVGVITWYAQSSSIKKNYGNFKLNRQVAFNLFEKILAPNLHRVVEGRANMTNVLEVVSRQIPQEMYRHYVDRLVVDMHMYPGQKEPFDNFARTFSGENEAFVFTNALYQITQGNDSTDTIYQLLATSNRQLGQQQDKIMKIKQRPFKGVQYLLFATFFPFTVAYYATTIMSYISSFHM